MRKRTASAASMLLMLLAGAGAYGQSDSAAHTGKYWGISAGLGATVVKAADVVDYINMTYQPADRIADFGTAVEFFGSAESQVSDSWMLKAEYSYLLKSYNVAAMESPEVTYTIQMPTLLAEYFISGKGYLFQFGGGVGYRSARLTIQYFGEQNYHAHGAGFKLEAVGNTAFDEHLFGYIGGDLRADITGDFTDTSGKVLTNPLTGQGVSMNYLGIGLKFGLTYYF